MDDIDSVLGVMPKLIIFLLCYKKHHRNFFIKLVTFIVFQTEWFKYSKKKCQKIKNANPKRD